MSESPSLEDKVEELKINDDDVVDPWNVTSTSETGVDYDKLIGLTLNHFVFRMFKHNLSILFRAIW